MKILIDKFSNKVLGIDIQANPFTIEIDVNDNFTLTKTVQEVNIDNPLRHKVNSSGELLYKDNYSLDLDTGEEIFEEVTYSEKVLTYEEQEHVVTWEEEVLNEEGEVINIIPHTEVKIVQVPKEVESLMPIMEYNLVSNVVTLKDRPEVFTLEEVLQEKYKNVLEESQKDNILADIFLNEEDIDLLDVNHSANTGIALLQLLPLGQAKTKAISLNTSSTEFELLEFNSDSGVDVYINDTKFVNGKVTLTSPVTSCTLKFINTTDRPKIVRSYAVGY